MRLTDDEIYYDHPILYSRNPFEKAWSRGWHKVIRGSKRARNERKELKKQANKSVRRAVKESLKGIRPRIKKRPGDSWEVF